MSSQRFETFLARLYADRAFRELFLQAPERSANELGLNDRERKAALEIDKAGLLMAARSYELKRAGRRSRPGHFAIWRWLLPKRARGV
jgi:hypothetical protein